MVLNIYLGILICITWISIAVISRYSSLSSIISSILSLLILIIVNDLSYIWVQIILVFSIIASHRGNIVKLILGKENKIKLT